VLLQLQQMPSAGESTEMAMEHQKQPVSAVVLQTMHSPGEINEREWRGRIADAHHRGLGGAWVCARWRAGDSGIGPIASVP
jgi:hypothetical protein